jgi:predicted nucleotidyltransferase
MPHARIKTAPSRKDGRKSNLREVRGALRELAPVLLIRWGVRVVGVFGSVARGGGGSASDVDLLVRLERPLGLTFVDLVDFLEGRLGRRVDLLSRDWVRPRLWREIEAEVVPV